ncbi:signal recognition particle-docking protein FtsY [Paraneptunicella aestuarii]|uniref:signal recognition particle-docking protein FtsY n=1 Tax=Paraneptunicella aestuarii TaxID=2831148 RepID=UPI001E2B2F14|nr:signal recognition particle-docking protein FtsY [Paraneptunicella aestuarii]UAA38528.1 signal recognition particle-docking protein FtsY [Paraneptunicella aestuarii]
MSKFFGWLKRNKPTQDTPQQEESRQELPQTEPEVIQEQISNNSPQVQVTPEQNDIISDEKVATPAAVEAVISEQKSESAPLASVEPKEIETGHIEKQDSVKNQPIAPSEVVEKVEEVSEQPQEKPSFFSRLKQGLAKTKANIGSGFANLFMGKKIDDELFEDLETQLLMADLGVETTTNIIKKLTESAERGQLKDADKLYPVLKNQMAELLEPISAPLQLNSGNTPFVILMVGVNGVGKTTTIGKMAKQFQAQGKKVMLAAGDTFRAAAVEQLKVWGERNKIPVVAQDTGSDSASVIYDALQSAKARNIDVLIADTAGRLQNKDHLMEELKKIVRVMKKIEPNAPHEIMLTIDAGTGQNAISQTKLFDDAIGLTGITLTKLDGTAKGGVIFALAEKFKVPVRYIGIGEGIDDLRSFNSRDFVEALFDTHND